MDRSSHKRSRTMSGVGDLLKLYGAAQENYENEFKQLFKRYKTETDSSIKQELSKELSKKREDMAKLLIDASDACKLSAQNMFKDKSKIQTLETIQESDEDQI